MKNRERINKTNIYDLIVAMATKVNKLNICVLSLFPNGRLICKNNKQDCSECIATWLNEEE